MHAFFSADQFSLRPRRQGSARYLLLLTLVLVAIGLGLLWFMSTLTPNNPPPQTNVNVAPTSTVAAGRITIPLVIPPLTGPAP